MFFFKWIFSQGPRWFSPYIHKFTKNSLIFSIIIRTWWSCRAVEIKHGAVKKDVPVKGVSLEEGEGRPVNQWARQCEEVSAGAQVIAFLSTNPYQPPCRQVTQSLLLTLLSLPLFTKKFIPLYFFRKIPIIIWGNQLKDEDCTKEFWKKLCPLALFIL